MKALKTYGVLGLLEWNALIPAGRAHLRIMFSGGALTAYGTTPATYSTKDAMVQQIIERSKYFKEGRIILLKEYVLDEPKEEATPVADEATSAPEEATKLPTAELEKVEVTCLDDAKDYLSEHFGCRNIRTWSDANKKAAEHGIEFVNI